MSARLKGRRRQVAALLLAVTAWAAGRTDIVGLVLVGSYASGRPRFGSDVDLILITTHPDHYLDHDQWLTELGTAWSADPGPAVGCGHRTPGATTHRPPRGTEHRGTGMGRHPARPWNPTRAGRRLPPPARSPEHPQRCPGREARPGSHVQAVGRHGWYRSGHRAGTSGASADPAASTNSAAERPAEDAARTPARGTGWMTGEGYGRLDLLQPHEKSNLTARTALTSTGTAAITTLRQHALAHQPRHRPLTRVQIPPCGGTWKRR